MIVLENLRLALEAIHRLLDLKMDKMDVATDLEILELTSNVMGFDVLVDGDNILISCNNEIFTI